MADPVVQEIKDRLDIVEVIGSYLQLKRAGANFRANCPFHNEKTPSFNVNSVRQIWHCFGCGEGGDVFTFVQKYEHLEFPEVLQLLADRAGVQLPERSAGSRAADSQQKDLRERLFRINQFAATFYARTLRAAGGVQALTYLTGRGLKDVTIDTWGIGYAPEDFHLLEQALLAKGARRDDLVLAGVIARTEKGTYDRFRGRITFPIFDFSGKPVGFSARILEDKDVAKYINSAESPIYNKSQILFGLFQAKQVIRELDYVVVVEGQMDCIKAHQAGFTNTVATSGTALTEQQLKILSRLTKNIKLCFDADAAGQRAAKKAGVLALRYGFAVKMVTVQGAKDPDELISQDPELWRGAVAASVWFIDYYLAEAERAFSARSVEQGKYLAAEVLPLVALLPDPLEKDHYAKVLAERFGLSLPSVREVVMGSSRAAGHTGIALTSVQDFTGDKVPASEKYVLGALLFDPALYTEWQSVGGAPDDFSSLSARFVMEVFSAQGLQGLTGVPLAQEALFMVESEKTRLDGNEAVFKHELHKSLLNFRLAALKSRQQQITADIRMAEGNNPSLLRGLQRIFLQLSTDRLDLERKIQAL